MAYVESAIKTVRNFYKAFEKKVRSDKTLRENFEVLREMDHNKKQYELIFGEYEALNNPTMEQLLEVEKKVFEFRNTIQRGSTYNMLIKNRYQADLEKRQRYIKELQNLEKVEDTKAEETTDPEKLLKLYKTLEKDNIRLKAKVDEQTAELVEAKKQLEELSKENQQLKKDLDYERQCREKQQNDLINSQTYQIQRLIEKSLNKGFKSFQTNIDTALKNFHDEGSKNSSEILTIKRSISDISKVTKKVSKETDNLLKQTKENITSKLILAIL